MRYASNFDYDDGISEREGQCSPSWYLIREVLQNNGAPAGTIGHWGYLAYSLYICVAESEIDCNLLPGCVWDNHCVVSQSVKAKTLEAECSDFYLGFDQFFDDNTPVLLQDSNSGAPQGHFKRVILGTFVIVLSHVLS